MIGTPKGIAASNRTIDIRSDDFFKDTNLQERLGIDPICLNGSRRALAVYLAAFSNSAGDSGKIDRDTNYFLANGVVRILITDDTLREKLGFVGSVKPIGDEILF